MPKKSNVVGDALSRNISVRAVNGTTLTTYFIIRAVVSAERISSVSLETPN